MDTEIKPVLHIDGINMADYVLDKNSYNPIVYIHKRFFNKQQDKGENIEISNTNHSTDKCLQLDQENIHEYTTKIINNNADKDPLLEQTIKFAKDIIPLTIPAGTSTNNVCYTIKSNKVKRKREPNHDTTFDKDKPKHAEDNMKREKSKRTKSNYSPEVSVTQSSQSNTLDDVIENRSLSYTLSEISDHKHYRKDCPRKNQVNKQRVFTPESYEAIACECINSSNESKIKLHLMNDKEKKIFCENITSPVVKAIKECFIECNHQNEVSKNMYRAMQNHAKKLDNIFEKLASIESKFDKIINEQSNNKFKRLKPSKLEELGRDIAEAKECLSSEEELVHVDLVKNRKSKTSVTTVHSEKDIDNESEKCDDLARGENISDLKETQLGIKPERPNRIPARFCWTDTVKIL